MRRHPRQVIDDLADNLFDAVTSGVAGASANRALDRAEREAAREALRDERRRRREAAGWRRLVAVGAGLVAGGLVSAERLPAVVAVGVGLVVAAIAYQIVRIFQETPPAAPKSTPPREIKAPDLDAGALPKSRRELIEAVLADAAKELKRLDEARRSCADKDAAALCERLVAAGERLCAAVAEEPARFDAAQRVLTYHLPKAAYVAESFLVGQNANPLRIAEARQVLGRMEMLIEKTTLDLRKGDDAEMDLEMRLINQALDEELGKPR